MDEDSQHLRRHHIVDRWCASILGTSQDMVRLVCTWQQQQATGNTLDIWRAKMWQGCLPAGALGSSEGRGLCDSHNCTGRSAVHRPCTSVHWGSCARVVGAGVVGRTKDLTGDPLCLVTHPCQSQSIVLGQPQGHTTDCNSALALHSHHRAPNWLSWGNHERTHNRLQLCLGSAQSSGCPTVAE